MDTSSGNNGQLPHIPTLDELDEADKKAQQQANQLLANEELKRIYDHGIDNPNYTPWTNPSPHTYQKVVLSPRYRQWRLLGYIVLICLFVIWFALTTN